MDPATVSALMLTGTIVLKSIQYARARQLEMQSDRKDPIASRALKRELEGLSHQLMGLFGGSGE